MHTTGWWARHECSCFVCYVELTTAPSDANWLFSLYLKDLPLMRPGENQTVTLTLINGALSDSTFRVIVDISTMGNSADFIEYTLEASDNSYPVPYNSSIDLNIDVFVSMNATDGLAASFTVRVESSSNSDVNDFISFDLVVTTSPPPEFTENEVCLKLYLYI